MPRNNVKKLSTDTQPNLDPQPPQDNLQSILGFVMPTSHVVLPSEGKFYPPDHPLHGCTEVEIKYLSAKELDILTSKNLLKKGIAVERMLQSIIVDQNIRVENLLIGDKNAIIVSARAGTFGGEYEVQLQCGNCDEAYTHVFDLDDVSTKDNSELMESLEFSENGTFFITLPQTKVRVECRLLTSKDEKFLEERAKKKHKMGLPDTLLTDQYKSFIVSLNSVTERGLVDEFVDVMPAGDLHSLNKEYNKILPDVDLVRDTTCSHCDAENQAVIPFTANFFWPEG
jgi:hypothetical protein